MKNIFDLILPIKFNGINNGELMINKLGKKKMIDNLFIHGKSIQYGPMKMKFPISLQVFFVSDKHKFM
jgi:hypothetical protein